MGHSSATVQPRLAGASKVRPFDPIPRDLRNDRRLTDGDVRLAAALIGYARNKADCWPSNARLASELGVTPRTIRNRLRRLEGAEWFRCIPDDGNRTGRRILLCWRLPEPPEGRMSVSPPPREAVSPEGYRVVTEKKSSGREARETRRPEPPAIPPPSVPSHPPSSLRPPARPQRDPGPSPVFRSTPAPENPPEGVLGPSPSDPPRPPLPTMRKRPPSLSTPELAELVRETGDPILSAELARRTEARQAPSEPPRSIPEMIGRIRSGDPRIPPMLAGAIVSTLRDFGSYSGHLAVIGRVARGELPPEAIEGAFREASNPAAKNPGAVYMHAIRRYDRRML